MAKEVNEDNVPGCRLSFSEVQRLLVALRNSLVVLLADQVLHTARNPTINACVFRDVVPRTFSPVCVGLEKELWTIKDVYFSQVSSFVAVCAGLNAAVILMNLTRMREVSCVNQMSNLFEKYKRQIHKGDQDLINLFFHFHPGMSILLSWNQKEQ